MQGLLAVTATTLALLVPLHAPAQDLSEGRLREIGLETIREI